MNIEIIEKAIEDANKQIRICDREIGHHQKTILGLQDEIDALLQEVEIRKKRISNVRDEIVEQTGEKMGNIQTIKVLEALIKPIA